MADLVPCTGRSEAPAARTWGRAFVFIPAVFCGSCRAAGRFSLRLPMAQVRQARAVRAGACRVVGGRKGCGKAGSSVPRALALPDSGKKRCVMLERSQGGRVSGRRMG